MWPILSDTGVVRADEGSACQRRHSGVGGQGRDGLSAALPGRGNRDARTCAAPPRNVFQFWDVYIQKTTCFLSSHARAPRRHACVMTVFVMITTGLERLSTVVLLECVLGVRNPTLHVACTVRVNSIACTARAHQCCDPSQLFSSLT